MGEIVNTFETNDTILKYSSDLGFSDFKYPFAYGEENSYFMLHQKYIPIQDYKKSTEENENKHLYKKEMKRKLLLKMVRIL